MRRLRRRGSTLDAPCIPSFASASASASASRREQPPQTNPIYGAPTTYEPLFVGAEALGRKKSFSPRPAGPDTGEEALMTFIRANLGARAETFAIRLRNRTPLKADRRYTYIIQHGTEEADLRSVEKDLTSGRLYRNGYVLQGGAWSRMLFGPRFAVGASKKQVHQLTYRRSVCTCLACLVGRARQRLQADADRATDAGHVPPSLRHLPPTSVSPVSFGPPSCSSDASKDKSPAISSCNLGDPVKPGSISRTSTTDVSNEGSNDLHFAFSNDPVDDEQAMSMPVLRMRPHHSNAHLHNPWPSDLSRFRSARQCTDILQADNAFAHRPTDLDFSSSLLPHSLRKQVQSVPLPSVEDLKTCLGAEVVPGELLIGSLLRINSRSAKIKFEDDVNTMYGDSAYAGPCTTAQLYTKVLAAAQGHYKLKRGKRNRRLYIRGVKILLPVEVGVVKVPQRPLYMSEYGSGFILHARQTMTLYVGTIQFEGGSLGSHIDTGIESYLGFGVQGGCASIFPKGRPMGAPRKLGVNELLLHCHLEDDEDLIVQCQ